MDVKSCVSKSTNGFCSLTFAFIWTTLHVVSLSYGPYPTTQKRLSFTQWFENFADVLPCISCALKFKLNLERIQFNPVLDMISREAFAKCVWRLHNEVNVQLNKDVFVSFEDMNAFYEQLRASECDENSCTIGKFQPRCLIRFVPYHETQKITLSIDENCIQNDKFKPCISPMNVSQVI